ncbi:MAG: hypothetical protein IJ386_04800, partial [Clostridia bacterium]|nr:hypothetical protein [Clostridia bacterium]
MKKFIAIVLAVISLAGCFAGSASAMTPYITYTYSIDGDILESPDAYVPDLTVNSDYMGLSDPLVDVRDVEVDDEMNVYVVDAGSNRVVVLDRYYKVKAEITQFVNEQG